MFTQTFIIPPCSLLFEFFQQIQKIRKFPAKHRRDEENDVKFQNLALISFFSFKMLFFRQSTTLIYGNTYTKMFFQFSRQLFTFYEKKKLLLWNCRGMTAKEQEKWGRYKQQKLGN